MAKKYTQKEIKLDQLVLDKENPRFAELYNGSEKESDIIEYLLYTESAEEVAEAISEAQEFYEDRPLWVYKMNEGEYLVKDGNRRCAAVKALQTPNKYELALSRLEIEKLPVLEYKSIAELDKRIRLEHNSGLFKKWGRIAKAMEIYRLFSSGNSIESLSDIDSNPKEFIKTATFYYEAVKIKGEDFKKLVREGKGKSGGKTVIFERLFKERTNCGFNFKRKTSEILIKDKSLFESYIRAIVEYLIDNPKTSSRQIDKDGTKAFLDLLKPYGFPSKKTSSDSASSGNNTNTSNQNTSSQNTGVNTSNSTSNSSTTNTPTPASNATGNTSSGNTSNTTNSTNATGSNSGGSGSTRHSVKSKPKLKRKKIPSPLKRLIEECYNLDENNFANSKTALTRVALECTLKYIVENTKKTNGKPIKTSNHFNLAFKNKSGKPHTYTKFEELKTKFAELITDVGIKKAFEDFDLQNPHQIIHNYHVGAVPANAKALCDNLIDLIEFMLQDETDLMNSLDLTKL